MAINKINYGGNTLIDLTNDSVSADTLVEGATAHNKSGNIITGTNPYKKTETDATVNEQSDLISQIKSALNGKAAGCGGGIILPELDTPATASDILSGKEAIDGNGNKITGTIATKTSNDLTANGATVTVPAGYYTTQTTKSVSTGSATTPNTTIDVNPTIIVGPDGEINVDVWAYRNVTPTVTAGYVSSGTAGYIIVNGSATKQLTTQAAKTITPTTSSQTAVASGVYTIGAITVAAIPSNYEDVATETNAYTAKIASLESAVAALETELAGKASGGSGGSVETCLVDLPAPFDLELTKVVYSNGTDCIELNIFENVYDRLRLTVAKHSLLYFEINTLGLGITIPAGDAQLITDNGNLIYVIIINDDDICLIDVDSSGGIH